MPQIPYTPHANATELEKLFRTIEPERVHTLIQQSYADDQATVIPKKILNDHCEIVDDGCSVNWTNEHEDSNGSFLQFTQHDCSDDISGPISDLSSSDEHELR